VGTRNELSAASGNESAPSDRDCRLQLDRILGSTAFSVTDRDRRFLAYVVNETLTGRADRIKAYTIAVEVFGRDASFDPQTDPIVRIEAAQIRRALEHYYLTAGANDPVLITIPKGGYAPHFVARSFAVASPPASPTADPEVARPSVRSISRFGMTTLAAVVAIAAAAGLLLYFLVPTSRGITRTAPDIPRVHVVPLEDLTAEGNSSAIARGLTEEIIGQLSKFKELVVVEAGPDGDLLTAGPEGSTSAALPRFAFRGSVELSEDSLRLQAKVTNAEDGSVLWANSYRGDLKVSQLLEIQADVARQVATALAQPYGVIFQADVSREMENPPADWAAYSCTLMYYTYRVGLDAKSHPAVRKCLEDAVTRFPSYATAWALLSQTYVDEIRFRYPIDPSSSPASMDRALDAARRAIELDPQNVRAMQAEMLALYFNQDFQAALKVGEQAMAINPGDTELVGEYGYRLALSGNWDAGCPLVAKARELNPGPSAYYESALALCAYFGGDPEDAVMWIRKTTAPGNPNYHVIAAAIYAEAGLREAAANERDWLLTNAPKLIDNLRHELALRFADPNDLDAFVNSLEKAGLPISR
jgi:TolB-like protein